MLHGHCNTSGGAVTGVHKLQNVPIKLLWRSAPRILVHGNVWYQINSDSLSRIFTVILWSLWMTRKMMELIPRPQHLFLWMYPNVPLLILYWSQEIQDHVSDTWNMSTPYIYHHRSAERTFVMYLYFFATTHTPYSSYLTLLYLINSGSYSRMFKGLLLWFLRPLKMMGMVLSLAEYFLIRCVSSTQACLHHL